MQRTAVIFGTHRFRKRFTLAPDGQYTTVTEIAEWARAPYDDLRKRLLLHGKADGEGPPHVLLLAPVRPGESATTTAIMLGACLADDARCLLLDFNFRSPQLGAALGLGDHDGLGVALRGNDLGSTERAILATSVNNLFAMPSRPDTVEHTLPDIELLRALVDRARNAFDYVIIDAAPVIGHPDTSLVAPMADGMLLVVAADVTPVDACVAARRDIESHGGRLLGSVLTNHRRYVPAFLARHLGQQEQEELRRGTAGE